MKFSLKSLIAAVVTIGLSVSIDAAAIEIHASSGYNDFNCKPLTAHRPLLLVYGTTLFVATWGTYYL